MSSSPFFKEGSTPHLRVLGKIDLFVYYGKAFHYLQFEKIVYDENWAHGMHFYVKVYMMTQQKWAD